MAVKPLRARPPAARVVVRTPLDGVVGNLLLRPWFDAVALHTFSRWLFPLSRAWAAASLVGTDVEAFCAEVPMRRVPTRLVAGALRATVTKRDQYNLAARDWEEAFFGPVSPPAEHLARAEDERSARAQAFMVTRAGFTPLHLRYRLPAVRWAIADEAEVARRHEARLVSPAAAFPPPLPRPIELSRSLRTEKGDIAWMRYPSTVGGAPDTAWARIVAPPDVRDPPTLIFLHGVAVESEFWRSASGRIDVLTKSGIRIIRPEGPGHGRRRPPGWYGGERAMALGPLGLLDLFQAWVSEIATLVAWARSTSKGPIAIGGISLGALTSQLAAGVAQNWPAEMRPDALFLVATSGDVVETSFDGSLGRAIGALKGLAAQSWSPAVLQRWRPLFEPQAALSVPAENVVMVVGTSDKVTPFPGAIGLAKLWQVPRENFFVRPQGHFSVALGLERDPAPFTRLIEILKTVRR